MTTPDTPPGTPSPRNAIISPWVDFLCCGGLSILAVAGFFVYAFIAPESELFSRGLDNRDILLFGTWINAPHFMASYRLLYRTRTQITQHTWASIYAPLILLIVIIYALLTPSQGPRSVEFANSTVVELFVMTATILLAWHYTGQAWGMTASFAYLAGIRMETTERRMIRSGCYSLLVWHILWACLMLPNEPPLSHSDLIIVSIVRDQAPLLEMIYHVWTAVVLLTIPLGIYGFVRLYRRTGKRPPLACLSPWTAIYLWYALIWAYPGVFAVLQIFHALQYLLFPIRVEINQYSAKKDRTEIKRAIRGIAYYLILVGVGYVVFFLPQLAYFWGDKQQMLAAMVFGFVNIHHYVIDGVIWKLRNPEVRRDLFAHIAQPSRAA
jgi:hypothetical protein